MPLAPDRYRVLTFDCYGTLIDWDRGIRSALREVESLRGCDLDRLLKERETAEHDLLAGAYRPYSDVLAESVKIASAAQGRSPKQSELVTFSATMGRWPAFPDSGDALRRLVTRYVLGLLSNVENKTLELTRRQLGAPFAAVITAENLKSYKPAPRHWEAALERLHQPLGAVLHVAGSLYHDVHPARALGFQVAWINRRGEPVPPELDPELVFPDLASLTSALLGSGSVAREAWE